MQSKFLACARRAIGGAVHRWIGYFRKGKVRIEAHTGGWHS